MISPFHRLPVLSGFLLSATFSVVMILSAFPAKAQFLPENPDLDRIPQYLLERASGVTDAPLSSVVTIGNWDNYSLGVDFAENNMAMKPGQPTWFFTAYNTNGSYHTENGIDWATNNPNFGTTVNGDPVVAYDSLGNLYYENMYGSITGCKVVKSTTNGASWSTAVTAIAGNDKNWIACDQTAGPYANYVYTTMTNNGVGNFARSTDHGATFASTFAPSPHTLPGLMVCVGPQGNVQGGAVYVVTNSGSSSAATYTFFRSNDGGATFSQRSQVQWPNYVGTYVNSRNSVQNMRTRPYPMIAADNSYGPYRGRLYCVYASNSPSGNGNKPDIFCRYSSDYGATWSAAIRVNDDVNPQNNHQWHPAVWCDKETGKLYVMWMDTRDTPTSDSAYIYATYSETGGATFAANQRISNAKMKIDCSTCGGGGTPRYQGDYNGVVSNKKVSMIGWTDFRAGTFQSMTAYFPDFALSLDHTTHTLTTHLDSATFLVQVPEVKLYTDTVLVSASVSPAPSSGSILIKYPSGNAITTFPGSKAVRVVVWGNVPAGNYTLTFTAAGPNGTPVHRRTATLTVVTGTNAQATLTLQPDRTKCAGDTVHIPVRITGYDVKNLSLYITYDHTRLAQSGVYYTNLHPSFSVNYQPAYNATTVLATFTATTPTGLILTGAKLFDLVFTVTATGASQVHIRRTPDPAPVSVLSNASGTPFTLVNYSDNTVTGTPGGPVAVSLSTAPALPVCEGTPVTFTAQVINGGTAPSWQWAVNGIPAGTNDPEFVYTPLPNDVVSCTVTSNATCVSGNPGTGTLTMGVVPYLPVSVSLTASQNPVPEGTVVTFTALPVNGGSSPVYQWFIDGDYWETGGPVFAYPPGNGDRIQCSMYSSQACTTGNPAWSNIIAMSVFSTPPELTLQGMSGSGAQCFDALNTITLAGGGTAYTVVPGSQVTLVSGGTILILPSTVVQPGAYLLGYITTNGQYCTQTDQPTPADLPGNSQVVSAGDKEALVIFPNPSCGRVSIRWNDAAETRAPAVLFNAWGRKVWNGTVVRSADSGIPWLELPAGVYFLQVGLPGKVLTGKVILAPGAGQR